MVFEEGLCGAYLSPSCSDSFRDFLPVPPFTQEWWDGFSTFDADGREVPPVRKEVLKEQIWGQLMGSPYSFPILCVVNLAVCRYVVEMAVQRLITLDEFPGLVNGDDVVMKLDPLEYELWQRVVADAGLIPSVGKNYLSRDFAIINSTLFLDTGASLWGLQNFVEKRYVNLDLIGNPIRENRGCLKNGSVHDGTEDLPRIARDAIRGFDPDDQDWLMTHVMQSAFARRVLSNVPSGVSYFVSRNLGGFGLPLTRPGLLSPQQIGYYTRVAGVAGSSALVREQTDIFVRHREIENLRDRVPRTTLFEEWRCERSEMDPPPGVSQEALLCAFFDTIGGCDRRLDDFIASARSTTYKWRSPPGSLFREHPLPYSERLLSDFPWQMCRYSVELDPIVPVHYKYHC